jgi:ribosomal protein S18 acetylase RimI-like enzyme
MLNIRQGKLQDLKQIKDLAVSEWAKFKSELTLENWEKLSHTLTNEKTYADLILLSDSFVCENNQGEIMGFGFLVSSGNPTEIYNNQQAYIRFVTVSKKYSGQKIGQTITEKCIEKAKENGERLVALHTSEMMNAARHIYEKLGFKIIKQLEPRLGKIYWLYELELK